MRCRRGYANGFKATAIESVQPSPAGDNSNCTYWNDERFLFNWTWLDFANHNNGNLMSVTASHGGPEYPQFLTFNKSFTYDGVNRLSSVSDSGGWSHQFNYDRYGNMWITNAVGIQFGGLTPLQQTDLRRP